MHAVDDFFVGRAEGGQGPGEPSLASHHEIIRAQAQAAVDFDSAHHGGGRGFVGWFHPAYIGGDGAIDAVAGAAGLFEGLEDVQVCWRELEGVGQAMLPFFARAIAAENHAAGAPGGLVVAGDFNDEVALFLCGVGEVEPRTEGAAGGAGPIENGAGRQRRSS